MKVDRINSPWIRWLSLAAVALGVSVRNSQCWAQLNRIQVEPGCGLSSDHETFRTNDKRDIHLFFGDFVVPQTELIDQLAKTQQSWREVSKTSRGRVRENFGRLSQLRAARKRLVGLLDSNGKSRIGWIATDLAEKIQVAELFKSAEAADKVLKKNGLKPDERKNDLLLLMSVVFDTLNFDPQLRGRAKVTVVNAAIDPEFKELERSVAAENDRRIREMMEAVPRSGLRTSDVEAFTDEATIALFSTEPFNPEVQSRVLNKSKGPMENLLKAHVEWVNSNVTSFRKVYARIAEQVLKFPGSGALFLRSQLSSGVKEALLLTCPKATR